MNKVNQFGRRTGSVAGGNPPQMFDLDQVTCKLELT